MSSARNPSFGLSDNTFDDIVDRLLLGKYEKYRKVSFIEAVSLGLHAGSGASVMDYVSNRWGQRGRYASATKNGPLSKAGITMRTNKLSERIGRVVVGAETSSETSLVWKIQNRRTYSVVCFANGTMGGALAWSHAVFGWTQGPESKVTDLTAYLVGAGGQNEAAARNLTMVGGLQKSRELLLGELARRQKIIEDMELLISTVISAAAFTTA